MTVKMSVNLLLTAVAVGLTLGTAVKASVFTYTFDPGTYYDFQGGTSNVVTGSFDFDTADGTFSHVNYNRGGETFTVASSTGPGAGPDQAYFGDTSTADYDVYQFAGSLSDGRAEAILAGFHPSIPIEAGGSVSVGTPTAAVPEPAAWALMLVGFGLVGSAMRGRKFATSKFSRG